MSTQLDQVKTTAGKILRRVLWIALAACIVFAIGFYFYRTYTISDGTRVGTLYKISRKGAFFKTYEGQLQLGGTAMMNPQSTWEFSAKNAEVYNKLQQYEGKMVKCHYKQMVHAFVWQGDTDYIVDAVEPQQ
jgi:hypothetical protein